MIGEVFRRMDEAGEIEDLAAVEAAELRTAITLLLDVTMAPPGEVPPPGPECFVQPGGRGGACWGLDFPCTSPSNDPRSWSPRCCPSSCPHG